MNNLTEKEKLLVIVDMINGFIKEGSMKDEEIAKIIPNIESIAETFIHEEDPIICIKDSHDEKSSEFKKFPVHCLKGTSESEIVDELKRFSQPELTFEKNSTSARENESLMKTIERMRALKEIVITGCCTDICVLNFALGLANFLDEKNIEMKIIVPTNSVETYGAPNHNREEYNELSFKLMKQAGINVVERY